MIIERRRSRRKKFEAAGIAGNLPLWFRSYLSDSLRQRVVLPGAESAWILIRAGVPQGFILGPLIFLLFINDIVTYIGPNIRLFADDMSLFMSRAGSYAPGTIVIVGRYTRSRGVRGSMIQRHG